MKGMSIIVKEVTKLVAGFIFVYGIYIVFYGHVTPGGGFVGGVILACSFILLMLAFGKDFMDGVIKTKSLTVCDCLGALAFLAIALVGFIGGSFFVNLWAGKGNFKLIDAGLIPLSNIAIGVKVSACLAGVFVALSVFRGARSIKE